MVTFFISGTGEGGTLEVEGPGLDLAQDLGVVIAVEGGHAREEYVRE
jgi:hypothetical protein